MADHSAFTVWITGLPASGKRGLAEGLAEALRERGLQVEVIDSGKMRATPLGGALGFSKGDRDTNVRRHAFAAHLLARHGVVAIVSAVSPYRATRERIRQELGRMIEVYVSTPRAACIDRDRSGNWARALAGEIRAFTGVDDPYEPPTAPEVTADLSVVDLPTAVANVIDQLDTNGFLGELAPAPGGDEKLAARMRALGYTE